MKISSNRLIVVLGMHRSGTSAITRGLKVLGVDLGDSLMAPSDGNNAKGFWEDTHLNALNIEMLNAIESEWTHVGAIYQTDVEILHKQGYFLRAVELLQKKVSGSLIFAFKDPRVAKLLLFWKTVFAYCKLDVSYVLAIRNPLSVAQSLDKRDGLNTEQSYLLWLSYVLASLTYSAGKKRVIVDFDSLMKSPENELKRIANHLELEIDITELNEYKINFLNEELRHTLYQMNDLLLDQTCPPIVQEIYSALLDVASDKSELNELNIKIVQWTKEFERLKSPLMLIDKLYLQKVVANQAVLERDSRIVNLNLAVTECDGRIANLNLAVAEHNHQIANHNLAIAEHDHQTANHNLAVAERDHQIANLNQAVAEHDHQIANHNQAVAERDHHIANLNQAVTEHDHQIANLNQAVAERDGQVADLNQTVAERDGQVANLNQTVTERDHQVANLNQVVAEHDGQICALNQAVKERENQIITLNNSVQQIYHSDSWRISKPLRVVSTYFRKQFPNLIFFIHFLRLCRANNKPGARQVIMAIWTNQVSQYHDLKNKSPIWAELRYGIFFKLINNPIKKYIKTKFGFFSTQAFEVSDESVKTKAAPAYISEYQSDEDFSLFKTDIKALAFYLPQFHSCPQNDEWWGKDFTEWSNTRQAEPRFSDHYQPREPHDDVGYYDLSDIEVMREQAKLARKHGIYGFCFYHYWFSGTRLLEKPVDLLLKNPDIDINFCLCWANENWTRTWDGLHKDILIEQNYLPEDAIAFIKDLEKYITDSRYLRIDNKPVIMVYKPSIIPNFKETVAVWRAWWKENSGGDLEIWCNRTDFSDTACKSIIDFVDAIVEFPPHVLPYELDQSKMGLDTSGHFYDYKQLVNDITSQNERILSPSKNFYRSVMLGWDNSARRKDKWSVWHGFSLLDYYEWLTYIVSYTRKHFALDRRFIFINAWNEWAEGTYLEPDAKFGYANINVTSRALYDLPFDNHPQLLRNNSDSVNEIVDASGVGSIAVHLHIFFEDVAFESLNYINNIPYDFDLYVTTDTSQKVKIVKDLFQLLGKQKNLHVIQVPNIGRDIAPLLVTLGKSLLAYDLIGHFHTKKSTTVDWGDRWRKYLFNNLLGTSGGVSSIFKQFEDNLKLGVVFPPPYPLIAPYADWGGNKDRCEAILNELGIYNKLPLKPKFPVGNMFWARTKALEPLLQKTWTIQDFEEESGQIKLTLAHAIERIWCYASINQTFHAKEFLLFDTNVTKPDDYKKRLVIFVHYSDSGRVSDDDLFYIQSIKKLAAELIFISNSVINPDNFEKLRDLTSKIIIRDNKGFDFSAFRDGMLDLSWDRLALFDELILANNSCFGPIYPFDNMFAEMESKLCDFWSLSAFPQTENSVREEAKRMHNNLIPFHLQSYFMVFNNKVITSTAFKSFWENVQEKSDILDVIAQYETQLTSCLNKSGYSCDYFLSESTYLQKMHNSNPSFNAVYSMPLEMVTLKSPLIKKKFMKYAPEKLNQLTQLIADANFYPVKYIEKHKE